MRFGGRPALLEAPADLVNAVLAELDPAAPASQGTARRLLLELALLRPLERLANLSPELDITCGDAAEADDPVTIGLRCTTAGEPPFFAALTLSLPTLRALLAAANALPSTTALDPALPVALALRLGAADLPLADLRAMRQGDVVLPTAMAGPDDVVILAGERQAWRGRLGAGAVTVTTARRRVGEFGLEGWTMIATEDGAVADAPIEEVAVRLVFELGRLEIPLGELGTVAPGHIFALGRDERQPIDLLVGGRRIGQGEIVSLGGTLGVRVLALGRVE